MTEYDPVDERPLDLDWQRTERDGDVWVSEPVATIELADGETEICLAIKDGDEEWVFWAEQWVDSEPHESISNTTYAAESVEEMISALTVIRDSVEETFGADE
ncbi:MAG: hypothetical protein ACQEVA_23445 [Myxococcota bacterium]